MHPFQLTKLDIDQQTELEDGDLFDPNILLLHSEHYPSPFLLRYVLDDVALFHESAGDHPSFMDASAHSQMHHLETRPDRAAKDLETRDAKQAMME